jgi:hypothetical protein
LGGLPLEDLKSLQNARLELLVLVAEVNLRVFLVLESLHQEVGNGLSLGIRANVDIAFLFLHLRKVPSLGLPLSLLLVLMMRRLRLNLSMRLVM